ncbi:MAG: alpha/beta fold hydrolase [Hyphomonadaceae bacterium]|nr:alpha/beta fold hydrolase [Hyphomonadaceae bacterium]
MHRAMPAEDLPETRFARSGDVNIAYQVLGEGPVDLLLVPGLVSHVETSHEVRGYTAFLRRLARFARLATFDKRGQGLSDRVSGAPTLEERADDVRAVMDAIGMRRAAVLGVSEGSMMSAYFAAAHPERASHLVLYGGMPKMPRSDDYPIGFEPDRHIVEWGTGAFITTYVAPSWAADPDLSRLAARFERHSCSPGNFHALAKMNIALDVRPILPDIRVPTLVLHRQTDVCVPIAMGRYYADHIPGAKFVAYPSGEHWPPAFGPDWDSMADDIEEFVTGVRAAPAQQMDRVLATVLFTDIVDSTAIAAELGDAAWRARLDEHDRIVRRLIESHRGRFIKSTGDGVLAAFDGPGRAVRCALSIEPALARLDLRVRAGLHTGEVEERGEDIAGVAVHAAARVMEKAGAGEVLVSRVVADLVAGAGLSFAERGDAELKGIGTWRLLAATM